MFLVTKVYGYLNSCQVIYSQFRLAIHQNDHQARRRFVEWAQNEIAVVSDFHKRILFSDEAHFWLNDYVNKQNCRIWSEANPQVYAETPLHPEKLTVWCALWAGGIIGAVVPTRRCNIHTARATIDLLKDTFGDRLISCFGPVNWPPRSCDLTPLDYFLWGYVKSLVYADKPQTLDYLEDNIRRVIADIRPQMLEKVTENWTSRLDYIRASRGSPMPEIIFKMKSHGIPSSRAAAVAKFRLLTGHDCLCRFNLVTSPICVLCDTRQDMTAAHLDECSALNDLNCIVKRRLIVQPVWLGSTRTRSPPGVSPFPWTVFCHCKS
ncbi:uncharacterized protein TNCV_1309361 [Trichonephila clavipes]|nr:uncharacterized protein TNCV_1309361 [Trichonephila clavipes]